MCIRDRVVVVVVVVVVVSLLPTGEITPMFMYILSVEGYGEIHPTRPCSHDFIENLRSTPRPGKPSGARIPYVMWMAKPWVQIRKADDHNPFLANTGPT